MTPWTVARQAPLSTGFPRQGHWSGFPFPSSRNLPDSGIKLTSPVSPTLQAVFTTEPPEKPPEETEGKANIREMLKGLMGEVCHSLRQGP